MAPMLARGFPLDKLKEWQPFELDALGLVTLLGADEVARAVGCLTRNAWTDYLPVFGAFKVASDQIASVEPGFALYNLSDYIYVTELAPWFTRWLNMNMKHKISVLQWTIQETPRSVSRSNLFAMFLGALVNAALLALACTQGDRYGIANSISMIFSVLVRAGICAEHRGNVDAVANKYRSMKPDNLKRRKKKFLFTAPDGKVAIGYIPIAFIDAMLDNSPGSPSWSRLPSVARSTLLPKGQKASLHASELKSPKFKPYIAKLTMWTLRACGWLAFGVQLVAIGQSYLPTQLCTIILMTLGSVAAIYNFGVVEAEYVGASLIIKQCQVPYAPGPKSARNDAYALLEPDADQQTWMRERGLLPSIKNDLWYRRNWEDESGQDRIWDDKVAIWSKAQRETEAARLLGLHISEPQTLVRDSPNTSQPK